uniref:winged helix-turn-helix domain-containing protein n=1 Tax=Pararhizobium sp. IMCC3301 TaxID=3067904 RepID=UPI0027409B72|nr:winged helix-turn-helix domain-containing protein [Pararhizobium sp. IMCC3301]
MDAISFLDFEVRPSIRQLTKRGQSVAIGARAFDLLLCLIENRDRVMGRDELFALVWEGMAVGDNNLNVQVSTLRKLLGAAAIVTVPKRGLRFGMDVIHEPAERFGPQFPALPDKPSVAVLPFLDLGDDPSFGQSLCS